MTTSITDGESMYEAVLDGDWVAAEVVVQRAPNIARDEITERGDRALHLAAAMGHEKIVQKLVEQMILTDLALLDGRGCTACCYAAISGKVEIADILMRKNPSLVFARDKNNMTPLHKAAFCGNREMVSYFLKSTKVEDFSREEWFDVLLLSVRTKMYDVGLEIVERDGCIATMKNEDGTGTALHILARQEISHFRADEKLKHPVKKGSMLSRLPRSTNWFLFRAFNFNIVLDVYYGGIWFEGLWVINKIINLDQAFGLLDGARDYFPGP